jgi:hypothetical protein
LSLAFPARGAFGRPNFAIETSPALLSLMRTPLGRLLLVAVCVLMLRPLISLWPAMAVAAAAMSLVDRRYAGAVTSVATVAVFALSPNWYLHDHLASGAREAGVLDATRSLIDWAAPAIVVAVSIVFLAVVRSGRPRWMAAYPQVALALMFLGLLSIAAARFGGPEVQRWLWSLTSAFSGYMWVVALIAMEQRNRATQVPFFEMLGSLHPFWTLPATPFTVAPRKLKRLAACDDSALAVSQLKAFKLILWAYALWLVCLVFDGLAHKHFGVPTFREALDAGRGGDAVAWSTRWLCLFVDFFDSILHLAFAGHIVIACARLAGYNLPRNTYRPLEARTIAEFWGRYYYYFKELMLNLFYFPTYLACFRKRPQLRAAFATFMAAGVGNLLFHSIREFQAVAEVGPWQSIVGLQTYAFYCLALSAGIAFSQWRNSGKRPVPNGLTDRALSFACVMGFFCLLHIFDDMRRTVPLSDHLSFLVSLFEPWS